MALRVCYRVEHAGASAGPPALEVAQRDFTTVFGMMPRLFPVEERRWDAQTYLLWDSDDCIGAPTGASGTVDGLDALMCAVGIHINTWNRKGNDDESASN